MLQVAACVQAGEASGGIGSAWTWSTWAAQSRLLRCVQALSATYACSSALVTQGQEPA